MTDPVAALSRAGRAFGARAALTDVTATISAGELVALVGPNGGGKSTLLFLLAGLLRATSGSVTVLGTAAHELSRTATGRVGLVTARPGLYPLLTGRENLRHFGGLFGLPPTEVDARVAPLAQTLQLAEALDERVGRLSTGTQQKLSLVRALVPSPALLLFDEPTANLDPPAARALFGEIRRRADAGLACVIATHELPAVEGVADRALLVDGRLVRELRFERQRPPPPGPILRAWQQALEPR